MSEIKGKWSDRQPPRYHTSESKRVQKSIGQKFNDAMNAVSDWNAKGMDHEHQEKRRKALGRPTAASHNTAKK